MASEPTRDSESMPGGTEEAGDADRGRLVRARRDPELTARVVRRVPMRYAAGAEPLIDRPAHVRAASGIAWVGTRLAVIQDDASFVALVDPATGLARSIALPAGIGGRRLFDVSRRNKADKSDHEAVTVIGTGDDVLLVAFGSGSLPRRETIALLQHPHSADATARVFPAPRFYAALRASTRFAGSELNVEGAIHIEGRLRLFGRGNGAAAGTTRPVNATCEIEWAALRAHLVDPALAAPVPVDVIQYELGSIDATPLSFTDATLGPRRGTVSPPVYYTAAAEASPDATRDGEVAGSAIGVIEESDGGLTARWAELRDGDGARFPLKAEGVALVPGTAARLLVVADDDAHDRPSELIEVQLGGPWPG